MQGFSSRNAKKYDFFRQIVQFLTKKFVREILKNSLIFRPCGCIIEQKKHFLSDFKKNFEVNRYDHSSNR